MRHIHQNHGHGYAVVYKDTGVVPVFLEAPVAYVLPETCLPQHMQVGENRKVQTEFSGFVT